MESRTMMTFKCVSSKYVPLATAVGILFVTQVAARADVVELVNGDRLHGQVVSLDENSLRLQSATLGELKLPREKVAVIALGEHVLPRRVASAPPAPAALAEPPATKAEETVEDAVRKLQSGGVSDAVLEQLQSTVPGFAAPGVQNYFNEKVGGLASGKLNIGDIRKDAIGARDELEKLKEELGPDTGRALDGYLNMLNYFLRETEEHRSADEKVGGAAAE